MIKIDAEQTAVYNRYKQISFESHFDRTGNLKESNPERLKFIADPTLPDKIKNEYYDEVFGLIIEYAQKYNGNIPIPEKFIGDAKIAQEKNDEFGMWFADNCIKTNNGKIALEQICEMSGFSKEVVKHGMNRLDLPFNKDLKSFGKDKFGKYYKGGFTGCSLQNIKEMNDE